MRFNDPRQDHFHRNNDTKRSKMNSTTIWLCAVFAAFALLLVDLRLFAKDRGEANSAPSKHFRVEHETKKQIATATDYHEQGDVVNKHTDFDGNSKESTVIVHSSMFDLPIVATQSLHLDLKDCTAIKESNLRQAVDNLMRKLGLNLSSVNVMNYEDVGSVLVGILDDLGHIAVQTWLRSKAVNMDLQWTKETLDIQEHLDAIAAEFGGLVSSSLFSLVPRGPVGTSKTTSRIEPREIMPIHAFKNKLYDFKSEHLHIEVWETEDIRDTTSASRIVRSLYVNGEMKYSDEDGSRYHESIIHSAFIASSVPPKNVLIVSMGDIGLVREALKWTSVEEIIMISPHQKVVEVFEEFFPESNDCGDFGTLSCLDDPRVNFVQQDFGDWYTERFGRSACSDRSKATDKMFDVMILDSMDIDQCTIDFDDIDFYSPSESSQDRENRGDNSDSGDSHSSSDDDDDSKEDDELKTDSGRVDDFFSVLACGLNRFGVLAVDIGKGPSQFARKGTIDQELYDVYTRRIKQMTDMSYNFWHRRVFDVYVPSRKGETAIAVGMVPSFNGIDKDVELQQGVFTGLTNGGVNDFDGRPARVNLKLRRNLHEKANLLFFDGAAQATFKFPRADWKGVHCANPKMKSLCEIEKVFTKDYEEELFEYHLDAEGGRNSGVIAKRNIPKGTVTGLWDAATDLEIPAEDWFRTLRMAENVPTKFHLFKEWMNVYAYDGGTSGLGDRIYAAINSYHTWLNHACDGNATMMEITEIHPWIDDLIYDRWDPVGSRIRGELDHVAIARRDIRKGEFITDDYKKWDGFMRNMDTKTHNYDYLDKFCDSSSRRRYLR